MGRCKENENMNEEVVRKEIAKKLDDSLGCNIELIMKDNHTLGKNPKNAVRWCEIAREEVNKRY
jgi:glucose-6-phosphate-specific signal transduction histidine kinase